MHVYVAVGGENQILHFWMEPHSGGLRLQAEVDLGRAPGPLATDPQQHTLYVGLRSSNEIGAYRIGLDGQLSLLGTVSLTADPCYLATDRGGRFLLGAYYGAGQVTVHALHANGRVESMPLVTLATAPRAHCIQTDPSNRYVFVPHVLPANRLAQFHFDPQTGALTPNEPPSAPEVAGAGPRHLVFHPSAPFVYTSNEDGSSVTAYRLDTAQGTLTDVQVISTLPLGYHGENTCAQIHMHPSGRFLYVSNRGHDSIACFAVAAQSGRLSSLGQQPTEPIPRAFGIDPTGTFMLVTGQGSGRLASYRIDGAHGTLQPLAGCHVGKHPMWVLFCNRSPQA